MMRTAMSLGTALLTATIVWADPASAAFTQATCSTSVPDGPVPLNVGSGYVERDPSKLVPNYVSDNYQNRQTYAYYRLYMNLNVLGATVSTPGFDVESNFDFVTVYMNGPTRTFTGPWSAQTFAEWSPTNGGFAASLRISFTSDSTVTRPVGTYFNQMAPRCNPTVQSTVNVTPVDSDRIDGVLIKTGDVIYFNTKQSYQMMVSLNPIATTAGADFDLYVSSLTATPDDSNYEFRGYSAGANEGIMVPNPGYTRTLYIGVRSYNGAGQFNLRADNKTSLRNSIKVCTPGENIASSPNLANFKKTLVEVSQRAAVATTGSDFTPLFDVWSTPACAAGDFCNCDATCKVCTNQVSNVDLCGTQAIPGGAARIPNISCGSYNNPYSTSEALVHEIFGHAIYGYGDERGAAPAGDPCLTTTPPSCQDWYPTCGHSLMGLQWVSHGFCDDSPLLHCLDGYSGSTGSGCTAAGSNWGVLISHGIVKKTRFGDMPDQSLWILNNFWAQLLIGVVIH